MINLSQVSNMPFRYKSGDTFRLSLTFNYDVDNVLFELIIKNDAGSVVCSFNDSHWVRSGRKKTITKQPQELTISKGVYNLLIKHTFPNGDIRYRFDSEFIVF